MIINIEALRGLAALSVVLFHLNPLLEQAGLTGLGGGGVDIFFVISGFIMVHLSRVKPLEPAGFLVNRCLRIVPLYWLVTFTVFFAALIVPSLFKSVHSDIPTLLSSLFFVPVVQNDTVVNPVLFLGWTLNYEMFFYLLFAIALLIPHAALRLTLLVGTLAGLVVVAGVSETVSPLVAFYGNPLVLEFAFGIALAVGLDHAPAQSSDGAKISMLCVCLAALIACLLPSPALRDTYRIAVTGLPALVVVGSALLLERWGWSLNRPLVLALGKASYALYLTHIFITEAALAYARWMHADPVNAVAIAIAATTLAVLLAMVLSEKVEPPVRAWMQGTDTAHPRAKATQQS